MRKLVMTIYTFWARVVLKSRHFEEPNSQNQLRFKHGMCWELPLNPAIHCCDAWFLFARYWWGRPEPKRRENVESETMFWSIENKLRVFLFEKHLNEEEKVVIETWSRLINKINSWLLVSFSIKPEMNDTSLCQFWQQISV